jgi:hypothetical protein
MAKRRTAHVSVYIACAVAVDAKMRQTKLLYSDAISIIVADGPWMLIARRYVVIAAAQ